MARNEQLILNRYRPIGESRAGGFGTVRVAWDTRIQRKVAIKCIQLSESDAARAAFSGDEAFLQDAAWDEGSGEEFSRAGDSFDLLGDGAPARNLSRLPGLDEARTAAMLSDSNIVTVYDFEVQGFTAYLIMEYVDGMTLSELLDAYGDRLTLDVVAAVFASVSHALEVAHENQVLHLDIKPDNVLINRQGQVKVTDFGLAMLADASGFGAAMGGTIGYMPLEQMRQESLDARCDEWALASIVYEMLAGENPFLAPDVPRAEAAIEDAELVLPSLCWEGLDPAVDDVVFYALDPDREERYNNVTDFAEELEPFLGDPKRGARELAALVNHADEEEDEEQLASSLEPRVPLRERITPWHRLAAARAAGAAGSAAVAFVALSNMPQTSGLDNPLFWGLLALLTLAGALKPHLGALLGYFALSAALIVQNAPAAGVVLLAATATWWYFVGRLGDAEANCALVVPLAGAVGLGQLAPLAAGFCLPPVRAIATAAFSALVGALLAACGTYSLTGWDIVAYGSAGLQGGYLQGLGGLLMQPALWVVAGSWILAAGALAAVRLRPTRAFAVMGACVSGAVLLAGLCLAAWVASGQVTWAPSLGNLAATIIPLAAMLAACVLVPQPAYDYDDYDEGLDEA